MCRLLLVHSWKWLLTISPMASPSLWLREAPTEHHVSKRRTMLNFPCFPVLTTKAPSRDLHHPDSMRMTSPTFTSLTWSDQNTNPTKPVSSLPQAAATGPVYDEETIIRCGYIRRTTSSSRRTGVLGHRNEPLLLTKSSLWSRTR